MSRQPERDWSCGWARTKPGGGPETWGFYLILEGRGRVVRLYRGAGNRCRFYDSSGEQVGPEQANVAPAVAAAHAAGWVALN